MSEVLLALVDAELRDDVARCAAAAGYRLVVGEPAACRADWLRACAVVVDPSAVAALAATAVPRRTGVLLVATAAPPAGVWRAAMDLGAGDAALLPADEGHLVRTLTELRAPRRSAGGGLAVLSAHGGAGASVLSAATALAAGDAGEQVLLLDADDLGGGLDLILGIEDRAGLRWQDLTLEGGAVNGQALHSALPRVDDRVAVLTSRRDDSQPIHADAVLATLDAGRGHGDLVVVDLPRADTDVVRGVVESVDLVLLVTSATVAGCAAATQVAERLLTRAADLALAVRGPSPGGLRAAQIADAVDMRLVASYRPDPRLPARLEDGRPHIAARGPLGRAAQAVYGAVGTGRGA
ncbi:septum site-determining protein Ssd [Gordonia sp. DT30]|uniref:septum site-determining protein Ssd n=1 Tax=Gordonia sp. DT30 TaxID=3416546 RepID=UPI003CF3963B